MMITHHGLHKSGGINFLMQGSGERNAVRYSGRVLDLVNKDLFCPHDIRLPHEPMWKPDQRIDWDDPLLRFMLPNTTKGLFVIEDFEFLREMILEMDEMYGGDQCQVFAPFMIKMSTFTGMLTQTNLQPIVIVGCDNEQMNLYRRLSQTAGLVPRRVLIVKTPGTVALPPPFKTIKTKLDIVDVLSMDWKAIGSTSTYRTLRDEPLWI